MISPIDSRYKNQLSEISELLDSDYYYYTCCLVELAHFLSLEENTNLKIIGLQQHFKEYFNNYIGKLKSFEHQTQHDIKACELFVKDYLENELKIDIKHTKYVHFGMTSQDVVSNAYTIILFQFDEIIKKQHFRLFSELAKLADKCDDENILFVNRTHGQKAIITNFTNFFKNYLERAKYNNKLKNHLLLSGYNVKYGGACNNFDSLKKLKGVDYTMSLKIRFINNLYHDFIGISEENFVSVAKYGFQSDYHTSLRKILQNYNDDCLIWVDFCQNVWNYVSMEYFIQETNMESAGSSTMPNKVNPIKFENAEGNFKKCSSNFTFISNTLAITRFQRDLSDSVIMRDLQQILASYYLGISNLISGLQSIKINKVKIKEEVDNSFECYTELLQLFIKTLRNEDGYELTKSEFKGKNNLNFVQFELILDKILTTDEKEKFLTLIN
jgi:adenylosuccinate lyase